MGQEGQDGEGNESQAHSKEVGDPMTTKRAKKSTAWMDDGDDAHFSDNPAVPKKTRKKWRSEERKMVTGKIKTGAGASGRTGKYVGGKKKTTKKRVGGK